MNYKQVIVMRKDLGMRKGKIAAQAAHASMKVFMDGHSYEEAYIPGYKKVSFVVKDDIYDEWVSGIFTKICVSVSSEEQLLNVYKEARNSKVLCSLIEDCGLTEFKATICNECKGAVPKLGYVGNHSICRCVVPKPGEKVSVPTYTCCAVGPDNEDAINKITGKLPLL